MAERTIRHDTIADHLLQFAHLREASREFARTDDLAIQHHVEDAPLPGCSVTPAAVQAEKRR